MAIWTNSDGLEVRFGIDRQTTAPDGVTSAEEKVFVFNLEDATKIGDTDTAAVPGDATALPAGAVIKDSYFVVDEAFTSGGLAVLDIGLKQADGTAIDADGIDVDVALGALAQDAVVVNDGALIGKRLTADGYVTFTYDTAAYTAGAGKLVIKYVQV